MKEYNKPDRESHHPYTSPVSRKERTGDDPMLYQILIGIHVSAGIPTRFLCLSGKMILIFAFQRPFSGPDGLKYVAKTGAVERPLRVIWRGANRPYFGKMGMNWTYSPQEQKPGVLQGFPGRARIGKQEKKPV
jgi:hypothetical protein